MNTLWIRAGRALLLTGPLALLIASTDAISGVYKCTGPDGQVAYQNQKCADGQPAKKMHFAGEEEREREKRISNPKYGFACVMLLDKNELLNATPEEVLLSCGRPSDINRHGSSHGETEQWVYRFVRAEARYIYFSGDRVKSWSD